jgi:hypothetical protein
MNIPHPITGVNRKSKLMESIEIVLTCPKCEKVSSYLIDSGIPELVCRHCLRAFDGVELYRIRGYIYVLSNPGMPGILKIGYTERDVETRATEHSQSADTPKPFVVEAYFGSNVPFEHEQQVHKALDDRRRGSREFFRVSLEETLRVIYDVCGRPPSYSRSDFSWLWESRMGKPDVQTELRARIRRLGIRMPKRQIG